MVMFGCAEVSVIACVCRSNTETFARRKILFIQIEFVFVVRGVLATQRQWTSLLHFNNQLHSTAPTHITTFPSCGWNNEWKAAAIKTAHVCRSRRRWLYDNTIKYTHTHTARTHDSVGFNCAGASTLWARSFMGLRLHRIKLIQKHTQKPSQHANKMWILFIETTIISARCLYAHEPRETREVKKEKGRKRTRHSLPSLDWLES